jgi:hypothetical protein
MLWRKYRAERSGISFVIGIEIVERVSSAPHNAVELLKVEHSVSISVGLLQHFLELVIGDLLAHLGSDAFEVFKGDFVEVVLIKQFENLHDFLFGVTSALSRKEFTMRAVMTPRNSLKLSPSLISLPISA